MKIIPPGIKNDVSRYGLGNFRRLVHFLISRLSYLVVCVCAFVYTECPRSSRITETKLMEAIQSLRQWTRNPVVYSLIYFVCHFFSYYIKCFANDAVIVVYTCNYLRSFMTLTVLLDWVVDSGPYPVTRRCN